MILSQEQWMELRAFKALAEAGVHRSRFSWTPSRQG
jgi:hypothetical protein